MNHDVTLSRSGITLRPLRVDDAHQFRAIVDVDSWSGMSCALPATDEAMGEYIRSSVDNASTMAFAVESDGDFVGQTTFYDIVPELKVDVGKTIYSRAVWGTRVNPTAKVLMFGYAFDVLHVSRVALRCDSRNAHSHRAIRRLGATYEGTLRRFRGAADGTVADVDYFSVLPEEWPAVRARLEERAAAG